ncbi:flagellar filament capping protein FliD [Bacillus sp. D386]|uniref:flagellar filament capping protein FliD n=1 Tax=Bacillus sp. D386 TaxID=2587155 RepID=UPI00112232D1|nr:flagellar filament capping protein FliD [Bacillus sp. D386]
MRISGLASGIDTDTMVKQLMQAERIPLDKLKQNKQTLEWKRDDYRSINTLLTNFRQDVLNMKLSSSYRSRTTSSTNDAAVTATATSGASATSYQLSDVKLAKAASLTTIELSGKNPKMDSSKSLESMLGNFSSAIEWKTGVVETQKFTANGSPIDLKLPDTVAIQNDQVQIKVAGKVLEQYSKDAKGNDVKNYTIDKGTITFENNIPASGSAIEVNYVTNKKVEKISIAKDATSFQLSKVAINEGSMTLKVGGKSVTVDENGDFSVGTISGTVNFKTGKVDLKTAASEDIEIEAEYTKKYTAMNMKTTTSSGEMSETFFITSDQSLDNVISKVNSSKLGLNMFYDSFTDKISMTRKETGTFSTDLKDIQIDNSSLAQALQLTSADYKAGSNALLKINGLETQRASNTFTMNGVTFTLKSEFTEAVTVGINNDTTKVYDNIKGFVDKYNELIATIQSKVSEERNRNYLPLTDDERDSLSEKEVEKWENIAKTGMLRNDSILNGALDSMRGSFYSSVNTSTGMYSSLSSIGITTTSDYMAGGKLEINETKLKQALEDDPESVEALFASEDGILSKLQKNISAATDQLKARAGTSLSTNATFTMGRDLTNIDDRISRFEDRLVQVENRYYKQFTAMEKAIQQANSQSGYLSSMFATG